MPNDLIILTCKIYNLLAVDAQSIATGSVEGDMDEIVTDDDEMIVRRGNSFSTTSRNSLSR